MPQQQTTFQSLEEVMSKFQLSATKWSKLVCSAVLVSGLSNAASAQQAGFEGLPSFPGLTQTGTTPAVATQTGTPQSSTAPQVAMPQSQSAISEQQLINSMPNSLAPAAQNPVGSQAPATVQSAVGAMGAVGDESLANATASMEDAHASQMEATLGELQAAHAHAYNTLAAVLDKVPADARPAIQQAMEQSRQGYQKTFENRERHIANTLRSKSARRGRDGVAGNGRSEQHMQAGQHRQQSQPGFDGRQGQFAGQQPNLQQGPQSQVNQQGQQSQTGQQGYAGQRPNPIQARSASGPAQPNFGTAQFNSARDTTLGASSGSPQGSTPGLIEGIPSINPQANPSVAQPGNRNYSTPEMNRAAPGRPLINGVNGANGVNGTAQGNNFGVPANQRNPNFGTNQPGSVQGSNGQNVNGQNSNGQGMSRPSTGELNRYNQTKPSTGYNSQPTTTTGNGSTPTGNAPGTGFNGFGTRQ